MKKRYLSVVLAGICALSLAGCGGSQASTSSTSEKTYTQSEVDAMLEANNSVDDSSAVSSVKEEKNGYDESTNVSYTFNGIIYSVPSYFGNPDDEENSTEDTKYFYAEKGDTCAFFNLTEESATGTKEEFLQAIDTINSNILGGLGSDSVAIDSAKSYEIAGMTGEMVCISGSVQGYDCIMQTVYFYNELNSKLDFINFMQTDNSNYDYTSDIEKILKSAKVDPDATVTEPAETSDSEEADDSVPTDYRNALKRAESYSSMMHMSKQGIYDQLTSEYGDQFSAEAAQYAIDNIQADWNANALAKAKSYQEMMSMSTDAIYDQLVSEYGEKFTAEEAQYAIDNLNN